MPVQKAEGLMKIHSTAGLGWVCPKCRYHNLTSNSSCQNCERAEPVRDLFDRERVREALAAYAASVRADALD